jgi:hypothetical protein
MKKDFINSAFTFGILLIILGLLGRKWEWKQADTLFMMGVIFELTALVSYLIQKFKK